MLLQILVRLQNCGTQSFSSSLGIIRFSSPLAASTGACHDCRRLFIEQSLPVQEGILQSDATGHQDLDKKEWPTFHATGQHFGSVPPPMVRTYPTGHQSHYKIHHQLQSTFEGAIFHCEDKHASTLRIYCPCLYYHSIESTFQDLSIFEPLPDEPSSIVTSLVESLHRQHGKAYPWAVGPGRQLPTGYILAKRKKDFQSGRPIISFVESPFRPMLNILARPIFQLIPSACPDHFATGDVYTLLSILREAPVDADLILVNQDLAGFFTSIDQERFIRSWFMLLDFLRPKMNVCDDEVFSVYPGKSNNPGDIIKGRTFRRLNVTRKIIIKHVPDLIKSALDMQTFALGKRCVRQRRGSPMGSPLSPALCLMVVSISEQIWSNTFRHLCQTTICSFGTSVMLTIV